MHTFKAISAFAPELFEHISPSLTIISDGPVIGTSATDRYNAKTGGWPVNVKGSSARKYCLTNRNDGAIIVE